MKKKKTFVLKLVETAKAFSKTLLYSEIEPNVSFHTKRFSQVSDVEIKQFKNLFDEHYGEYSLQHPKRPGERARFPLSNYREMRDSSKYYVSYCMNGDDIIGHAIYILVNTRRGYLSWIVQLVVHSDFRRIRIAKRLLLSVWGFSSDRAWGLATPNPLTVKTLESATFRKVTIGAMEDNKSTIKEIAYHVKFINIENWKLENGLSIIDTNFYIDHKENHDVIDNKYGGPWRLGALQEGHEWIAFTFNGQDVNIKPDELSQLIRDASCNVTEAYERMDLKSHSWNKYTEHEVQYIIDAIGNNKSAKIVDFGCGDARHLDRLKELGFVNVFGIDNQKQRIHLTKFENTRISDHIEIGDCRTFWMKERADLIICLYDVIGSYYDDSQNRQIIENIRKNLKYNGIAIISVLNYEATESIAKHKVDSIYDNPSLLFKLKPSNDMQTSGNIFNPDNMVVETNTQLIYRKEKFIRDGRLASEHLIIDRRYKFDELCRYVEKNGFSIIEAKCVKAGEWMKNRPINDPRAKEILICMKRII